ncbi:MAG: hypothetical protein ACO3CI_08800, partial [Schleiferiaceae bacterium]
MAEEFRDAIFTVDAEGHRRYVHPKRVTKGRFVNPRRITAYALIAWLFLMPWLRVNGLPFIQLDVLHRRFILLGQVFWPQDFHLLVLTMILGVLSIALFTVAYGRRPVLWNVDLAIREPCLFGVIGPNGAGKSTLLKAAL